MENYSEQSNELSNFIKAGQVPDEVRDSHLLGKTVLRSL